GGPYVHIFDAQNGELVESIVAYDPFFNGGVRVAQGDFNGDGFVDFVTTVGPGGGPDLKVFNGVGGSLLNQFSVYENNPGAGRVFTGGVYVSAGDVNHDGVDEIITGADKGGGPDVKATSILSGTATTLFRFFAYDPNFTGGVRVGASDVNGDGFADVITAAGPGGGSD